MQSCATPSRSHMPHCQIDLSGMPEPSSLQMLAFLMVVVGGPLLLSWLLVASATRKWPFYKKQKEAKE